MTLNHLSSVNMGYCTKFAFINGVPYFQFGPGSNGIMTSIEVQIQCEKLGNNLYRFYPSISNGYAQENWGYPAALITTNNAYFVTISSTPYTLNNEKNIVYYKETIPADVTNVNYDLYNTGLYIFHLKPLNNTSEFNISFKFAPLKVIGAGYHEKPVFFLDGSVDKFAQYISCDVYESNGGIYWDQNLSGVSESGMTLSHQKGIISEKIFAIDVTDTAVYVGTMSEV